MGVVSSPRSASTAAALAAVLMLSLLACISPVAGEPRVPNNDVFPSEDQIHLFEDEADIEVNESRAGRAKVLRAKLLARHGNRLPLPSSKQLTDSGSTSTSLPAIYIQVHTGLCTDYTDWVDSAGNGCAAYSREGWCGASWLPDAAVDGVDAGAACCSCGGGRTRGACIDHFLWAADCEQWRASGWCAHGGVGPNWNAEVNGTFESYTKAGVSVGDGCCDCGRELEESFFVVSEALQPYRNVSRQVASISFASAVVSGSLPEWIGDFEELELLDFSFSGLAGSIPASIASMKKLQTFAAYDTSLTGSIPSAIGSLRSLSGLDLESNSLRGSVPSSIGELTALTQWLYLGHNSLTGTIPERIQTLSQLEKFYVHDNELNGTIPSGLRGMSALKQLILDDNRLTGPIPDWLGALSELDYVFVHRNTMKGTLPHSIGNLTSMKRLSVYGNELTGSIPGAIGKLKSMDGLWIHRNQFSKSIPASIGECESLVQLNMRDNPHLTGSLPPSLVELQALARINADFTGISGTIPDWLGNISRLFWFSAEGTSLTGTIPTSIGKLRNLGVLTLSRLSLAGTLPVELFQLPYLRWLYIDSAGITGAIPDLSAAAYLGRMHLKGNSLRGSIPSSIGSVRFLNEVVLDGNRLSGSIPDAVCQLTRLWWLMASEQKHLDGASGLTGTLPACLGDMVTLSELWLDHNSLTGSVPQLSALNGLTKLRLQNNALSGDIGATAFPVESLQELDISVNPSLSGGLRSLENATSLERLVATGCNLTHIDGLPPTLRRLHLGNNSLSALPAAVYSLPGLEILDISMNEIRIWPLNGAYAREDLVMRLCGTQLLEEPFEWPLLHKLDVSHNPLAGTDVYMFLQTLYWAPSLVTIAAEGCGLHGEITSLDYRTSFGNTDCGGATDSQSGVPKLTTFNLRQNRITKIMVPPPALLSNARFDENNLDYIDRGWFNEGVDVETQQQRFALASLNLSGNPALRFSTEPALATCGPETLASTMSADPSGFQGDASSYECTSPCPPWGMTLVTDPGLPDEGSLCRCKEGFGIQPEECWDWHWQDDTGMSCQWHAEHGGNCSQPEVAAVCCHCGGSGAGGNGKHCSQCPSNTYSHSPNPYRHRSECVSCPAGSNTTAADNSSSASSVCACQCPIGSYMHGADHCQVDGMATLTQSTGAASADPSSFSCFACPSLRTTLSPGSFSAADCICDLRGIAGLVEGVINGSIECGCERGTFLKRGSMQCEACGEGEDCEWSDVDRSLRAPPLQPGFWTATAWQIGLSSDDPAMANFNGHSIYKCYSDETCIDERGTCAAGRHGLACSLCKPGFSAGSGAGSGGPCVRCEGSTWLGLVSLVLSVPLIVVAAHILLSGDLTQARGAMAALKCFRISARQVIRHVQVLSVISGFSIAWPLDVAKVFELTAVFDLSFLNAAGIGCMASQQTASLELGVRFAAPIVFGVIAVLTAPLLSRPVAKVLTLMPNATLQRVGASNARMDVKDALRAVYWIFTLMFATLLNNGLLVFVCDLNPNDELTVHSFPHLHCLGSRSGADDEWLALSLAGIAYNAVCMGGVIGTFIWIYRRTWKALRDSHFAEGWKYTILFEDFRDMCAHWPLILLARDVGVNAISTAMNNFGATQLLTTAFGSLYIGGRCFLERPYADMSNNLLEVINSFAVFTVCVFTAGMGFSHEPGVQDLSDLLKDTDGEEVMITRGRVLLAFQLIAIIAPFVIVAYQVIILLPKVEENLPVKVRSLQDEERRSVLTFLTNTLDLAESRKLQEFLGNLDDHDLRRFTHFLGSTPAAAGMLQDAGVACGNPHGLLCHAVSKSMSHCGSLDTTTSTRTSEAARTSSSLRTSSLPSGSALAANTPQVIGAVDHPAHQEEAGNEDSLRQPSGQLRVDLSINVELERLRQEVARLRGEREQQSAPVIVEV